MDAYEARKKKWEELDVTKEELKNLTECLKKEEFRKLFIEYAEEVTNPENRKIYEKEITQLEKDRGVDVTFVNPEPGYVIKTSVNGDQKCFLNISKSDIVGRPISHPSYEQGHRGLQWSIPYTLVPPRDDLDKKYLRCIVFDVVFHPDTLYLASKSTQFREVVTNTAMDGVEQNFKVNLDRKNLKFPKLNYKGACQPAVIRTPSSEPTEKKLDMEPEIYQKLMASYDENREHQVKRMEEPTKRSNPPTTYYKENENKNVDHNSKYVTPKFSIKHQSDIELEDFNINRNAKMNATVPKKLIVTIDLPLLKAATDASLEVQEYSLSVRSEKPAKYLLELPLPYRVDADMGNAKFISKYKKLVVTLPVVRPMISMSNAKEDSGVDSDHGSPIQILRENSMEDLNGHEYESNSAPKIIQECETVLTMTEMENESEDSNNCDIALRTNEQHTESFLDTSIKYTLPTHVCNIFNNQLAITVNVKNVTPNSIRHRILENSFGLHVLLTSIGAGFFPQHYSLCLKITDTTVEPESFTIEPWDNNVIFNITLKDTENLARYYVGLDEEFMQEKEFLTATSLKNQLKELTVAEESNVEIDQKVNVQEKDNEVLISIMPDELDFENKVQEESRKSTKSMERRSKARSISESSGDELPSNCIVRSTFSKGILKSRRTHTFSRSVSESSTDENAVITSSIDCHYDSVPDIHSESDSSSLKKTVRFNDVVSRKLYRFNSSILGQRKKNQRKNNQRKMRNKRRADDRKMSESENSETEEREKYKINQKSGEDVETVKPILNKDKKQQKTANIEIQNGSNDNRHSLLNRKSGSEEEISNENRSDNSSVIAKNGLKAEFKNDLIFDLDM